MKNNTIPTSKRLIPYRSFKETNLSSTRDFSVSFRQKNVLISYIVSLLQSLFEE